MSAGFRYCPTCRLTNPASARKCVCGTGLVPKWELEEEQRESDNARQRFYSHLWSVGATVAFGGILWAVYMFSGLL